MRAITILIIVASYCCCCCHLCFSTTSSGGAVDAMNVPLHGFADLGLDRRPHSGGGGVSIEQTWSDVYDSLFQKVFSHASCPTFHRKLDFTLQQRQAEAASGGADAHVLLADFLCAVHFVKCIGVPGTSKGGPSSIAWPMEISLHQRRGKDVDDNDVVDSHHHKDEDDENNSDGSALFLSKCRPKWSDLPPNVRLLRVVDGGKVDLFQLVSGVPSTVRAVEVVKSFVVVDDSVAGAHHHQQQQQQAAVAVEALSMRECDLDKSLFEAREWLSSLNIKRFFVSDSMTTFEQSSSIVAKSISALTTLDELHLIRSKNSIGVRQKKKQQQQDDGNSAGASSSSSSTKSMVDFDLLMKSISSTTLATLEIELPAPRHADTDGTSSSSVLESNNEQLSLNLGKFIDLESLSLRHVDVSIVPPSLPASLRTLTMSHTKLRGNFPDLSKFSSLEEVDFSFNAITEFPAANFKLPPHLHHLRLAGNSIRGPIDFTALPRRLVELNLSANVPPLTGSADLTKLPQKLAVFDISHNKLSGPVNMREFPESIRHLYINDNEFTGRYDVSQLPLLSVNIVFGNNKWDSLMPPRRRSKKSN